MISSERSFKRWLHLEVVHVYNAILLHFKSAIRKNEMSFAATWMDLEIIMLSEVNQRRTNIIDITYLWNLKKNDTNERIYKREIDSQT